MALSLAINTVEEELPRAAAFCRERALGLEVTAFAFPRGLDDGFDQRVQEHTQALQDIAPITSRFLLVLKLRQRSSFCFAPRCGPALSYFWLYSLPPSSHTLLRASSRRHSWCISPAPCSSWFTARVGKPAEPTGNGCLTPIRPPAAVTASFLLAATSLSNSHV